VQDNMGRILVLCYQLSTLSAIVNLRNWKIILNMKRRC
jgi:hypothetical protein